MKNTKKILVILLVLSMLFVAMFAFTACGVDGKDGTNGVDGIDGIDGANGVDGKDGIDGTNGINGEKGEKGDPGENGKDGADGSSSAETHAVTFDYQNGEANTVVNVEHGYKVLEPAVNPTKAMYEFGGWYVTPGNNAEENKWSFIGYPVTEDMTLFAYWTAIPTTDAEKVARAEYIFEGADKFFLEDSSSEARLSAKPALNATEETDNSALIEAINALPVTKQEFGKAAKYGDEAFFDWLFKKAAPLLTPGFDITQESLMGGVNTFYAHFAPPLKTLIEQEGENALKYRYNVDVQYTEETNTDGKNLLPSWIEVKSIEGNAITAKAGIYVRDSGEYLVEEAYIKVWYQSDNDYGFEAFVDFPGESQYVYGSTGRGAGIMAGGVLNAFSDGGQILLDAGTGRMQYEVLELDVDYNGENRLDVFIQTALRHIRALYADGYAPTDPDVTGNISIFKGEQERVLYDGGNVLTLNVVPPPIMLVPIDK